VLHGELLGETAAPGETEYVDRIPVTEFGEQPGHDRAEGQHRVRQHRPRRPTHARDVEADHLPPRVQRIDEGLQHLQAGADPVHQQQRRQRAVTRAHADPQRPPADRDAAQRPVPVPPGAHRLPHLSNT
jgi:hypothetical protein